MDVRDVGSGGMTGDSHRPDGQPPPVRIFISYRRDDTRVYAGRLYDALVVHFGEDYVFRDVDSLEPGIAWDEAIDDAIGSCGLLLAVIGRQWLAPDASGHRRLDDPEDRHRREIESAIDLHVPMFAVLVDGADAPRAEELPGKLKRLAMHQALTLGEPFKFGLQDLISRIDKIAQRKAEKAAAEKAATEERDAAEAAQRAAAEAAQRAAAEAAAEKAAAEKAATEERDAEEAAQRAAAEAAAQQVAAEKAATEERAAAEAAAQQAAEEAAQRAAEEAAVQQAAAEAAARQAASTPVAVEPASQEPVAAKKTAAKPVAVKPVAVRKAAPKPVPPKPVPPEPRAPSLREAVDQAGLKYSVRPDGTLAFPFTSHRVEDLVILAKEFSDEIVLFSTRLPKPGMFGQEVALRNLLRASFQANYTKLIGSSSLDLMAAAEIHPSMLTPGIAEGLIRGLAGLGDVTGKDLGDWQAMSAAIRHSKDAQANSIVIIDPLSARQAIRRIAEEDGIQVHENNGALVLEFPLEGVGGAHLKVVANATRPVISLCAFMGVKATGNKVQFMQQLLQLSSVADVARVGFDSDDEVAFLYEVPVVAPSLLEKVKTQFMLLGVGVAAVAAGNLRR
jgi:hypothetical protein